MSTDLKPSVYAPFMQAGEVQAGDLTLSYEVGGPPDGEVILLVMGIGAQLLLWPNWFCQALIDEGYRVIRFDNRDIGLSSKIRTQTKPDRSLLTTAKLFTRFGLGLKTAGGPYTLVDMADDIERMLDSLGVERVHLVGGSMGGMISQIFAAKYPHRLHSLNLIFTSNNRPFAQPPFPRQLQALIGRPKGYDEDNIVDHASRLFKLMGSPNHVPEMEARELARCLYRRSFSPAGVMRQFNAILSTGSLLPYDRQIRTRTAVIHGNKDRLMPPSNGRAVARAIEGASFHLIDGMGHDLPPAFTPDVVRHLVTNMQGQNSPRKAR